MLKRDLGMGHGDANLIAQTVLQADMAATNLGLEDVLNGIYAGPKAHMHPIHEALMNRIKTFGSFEVAPKKTYVSLRRKKQFAMIGPSTNTRFEVGLKMKAVTPTARLEQMPAGAMCQYRVQLSNPEEVDDELIGWIRHAFETSG